MDGNDDDFELVTASTPLFVCRRPRCGVVVSWEGVEAHRDLHAAEDAWVPEDRGDG